MTIKTQILSIVANCLTPRVVSATEFLTQKDILYKQVKLKNPAFYEIKQGVVNCYNTSGIDLGIPIRLRSSLTNLFSTYSIYIEPTLLYGTLDNDAQLLVTDLFFKADTKSIYPASKRFNVLQKLALYSKDKRIEFIVPTWSNAESIYSARSEFTWSDYLLYPASSSTPITLDNDD